MKFIWNLSFAKGSLPHTISYCIDNKLFSKLVDGLKKCTCIAYMTLAIFCTLWWFKIVEQILHASKKCLLIKVQWTKYCLCDARRCHSEKNNCHKCIKDRYSYFILIFLWNYNSWQFIISVFFYCSFAFFAGLIGSCYRILLAWVCTVSFLSKFSDSS